MRTILTVNEFKDVAEFAVFRTRKVAQMLAKELELEWFKLDDEAKRDFMLIAAKIVERIDNAF